MFDPEYTIDGPRVAAPDRERLWESVLRAPFRIVFSPLWLLGKGLEAGVGYVGPRFLEPKAKHPPKPGLALAPYINPGVGRDIGVGPAITWVGFPTADSRLHLTAMWSLEDRRRVNLSETIGDRRPVGFLLHADYDHKPNSRFYGIGNSASETDLSHFLLEQTSADAALLLSASPLRQFRIVAGFSSMSPGRGYNGEPLLEDVFPTGAPYEQQTTKELWYGFTADFAALDDERNPSRGAHGRLDLRRAAGLRSSDPDYYQWRVECRAYVPVFAKRRVIAVRGVFAGVDPDGGDATVMPYYRLAQSTCASRFAGYSSERFRDRQLMLGRIEYRWEILHRLSALALYELGEVAPSTGSFTLREAHQSIGGGLRLGVSDEGTMRIELAKGTEGLQAVFALGSDF